jgi:hypothetical protein
VQLSHSAPEFALRIKIIGASNRVPTPTEYARRGVSVGGNLAFTLRQNQTFTQVLDLRTLYELARDTYTVTVFRDVFVGGKKTELQGKTTIRVP